MASIRCATLQVYLRNNSSSIPNGYLTTIRSTSTESILLKAFQNTSEFFVEIMLMHPLLHYRSIGKKYNLIINNYYHFK